MTESEKLQKLIAADRYDPKVKNGISLRWLPGTEAATYVAQGDEHSADGTVEESALNAKEQIDKRMRKAETLKKMLPEPELYEALSDERSAVSHEAMPEIDVLLVGWGSTKSVVLDLLRDSKLKTQNSKLAYLHYTYLWPLKTERFSTLCSRAKKTILIEGNAQGQLGMLLRQETGTPIHSKILKYDGRPFFCDELQSLIEAEIRESKKLIIDNG